MTEFANSATELGRFSPEWGIVLGSGMASASEIFNVAQTIPYSEVPGLFPATVPGHRGQLLVAEVGETRVLLAEGRAHLYEGRSAREVTACVRLFAEAGVKRIVLTNAAGSLNREFEPGKWMVIHDQLNLTGTSPLLGGPNFVEMSGLYSGALSLRFRAEAAPVGVEICEGVYAGVLGPQYETPAEIRMLQKLGADAVGMSTVLEAIQAKALGVEVAGLSFLSNWGAGLSSRLLVHEDVLKMAQEASQRLGRWLCAAIAAG